MWGSGVLYAATGGHAFFAMAALCGLGMLLATRLRPAG